MADMRLTASQEIALRTLVREAQEVNARLQRDRRDIIAEVERDHRLCPGAIGTTHQLDLEAGMVREAPPQRPRVRSWQETYGGAAPEGGDVAPASPAAHDPPPSPVPKE